MIAWAVAAVFMIVAAVLFMRLKILRAGINGILESFSELLSEDTNSLITLSAGDRSLRRLATGLNAELIELKRLRRMYKNGDRELKDAVTNISHDLRTPLTAICGYLELLRREEKSENAERYIMHIENRTEAMKKLTEELFRYSVILSSSENMTFEKTDVSAVLAESIAGLYGAFVERGIEPQITLPDGRIYKYLNRDALSRIYGNILSNALKYSDGDLVIEMDRNGLAVFRNGAKNLGEVDVGRLFDRFFSVEAAKNSTGLGLSISKTLAEHMGGSISAEYSDGILSITVSWDAEDV